MKTDYKVETTFKKQMTVFMLASMLTGLSIGFFVGDLIRVISDTVIKIELIKKEK